MSVLECKLAQYIYQSSGTTLSCVLEQGTKNAAEVFRTLSSTFCTANETLFHPFGRNV